MPRTPGIAVGRYTRIGAYCQAAEFPSATVGASSIDRITNGTCRQRTTRLAQHHRRRYPRSGLLNTAEGVRNFLAGGEATRMGRAGLRSAGRGDTQDPPTGRAGAVATHARTKWRGAPVWWRYERAEDPPAGRVCPTRARVVPVQGTSALGHAAWDVGHHRSGRMITRSPAEFCSCWTPCSRWRSSW
jgi:hypothetical protein